jgi:AcrR family transcriptional regulator
MQYNHICQQRVESKVNKPRRTQAQRRADTYQRVLDSACRLFGEKGYSNTSLEEIASDCELTTRPVYHYFGNKKALFCAVNDGLEARIIGSMSSGAGDGGIVASWQAFLELCEDPGFRQIVLIDAPNILGRERWDNSMVAREAEQRIANSGEAGRSGQYRAELMGRMVIGAFTEAALMVAVADDVALARQQAVALVEELFGGLAMFPETT